MTAQKWIGLISIAIISFWGAIPTLAAPGDGGYAKITPLNDTNETITVVFGKNPATGKMVDVSPKQLTARYRLQGAAGKHRRFIKWSISTEGVTGALTSEVKLNSNGNHAHSIDLGSNRSDGKTPWVRGCNEKLMTRIAELGEQFPKLRENGWTTTFKMPVNYKAVMLVDDKLKLGINALFREDLATKDFKVHCIWYPTKSPAPKKPKNEDPLEADNRNRKTSSLRQTQPIRATESGRITMQASQSDHHSEAHGKPTGKRQHLPAITSIPATQDGNPNIDQCLTNKLGNEKTCSGMDTDAERETCVSNVWNDCQPDTRMKIGPDPTKLPKKYKPTLNCKQKNTSASGATGRATDSSQNDSRMKVQPFENPLDCKTGDQQHTPDNIAVEPLPQKACSQCTGTCQTVSWFSGHSSYNGIDVGGGQSPSQCIDQIKQTCEAGASRFMSGASCKN